MMQHQPHYPHYQQQPQQPDMKRNRQLSPSDSSQPPLFITTTSTSTTPSGLIVPPPPPLNNYMNDASFYQNQLLVQQQQQQLLRQQQQLQLQQQQLTQNNPQMEMTASPTSTTLSTSSTLLFPTSNNPPSMFDQVPSEEPTPKRQKLSIVRNSYNDNDNNNIQATNKNVAYPHIQSSMNMMDMSDPFLLLNGEMRDVMGVLNHSASAQVLPPHLQQQQAYFKVPLQQPQQPFFLNQPSSSEPRQDHVQPEETESQEVVESLNTDNLLDGGGGGGDGYFQLSDLFSPYSPLTLGDQHSMLTSFDSHFSCDPLSPSSTSLFPLSPLPQPTTKQPIGLPAKSTTTVNKAPIPIEQTSNSKKTNDETYQAKDATTTTNPTKAARRTTPTSKTSPTKTTRGSKKSKRKKSATPPTNYESLDDSISSTTTTMTAPQKSSILSRIRLKHLQEHVQTLKLQKQRLESELGTLRKQKHTGLGHEMVLSELVRDGRWSSDNEQMGMALANGSNGLLQANDFFLSKVGYSRSDLENGKISYTKLFHPFDVAMVMGWCLRNMMNKNYVATLDNFRLLKKDGDPNNEKDSVLVSRLVMWYLFNPQSAGFNKVSSDGRFFFAPSP